MAQLGHRKCMNCREWFDADPRAIHTQHYCGRPECRRASHAASQHRWLSKPENHDYFRGEANVVRVQAWRQSHPGYWRTCQPDALQDDYLRQPDDLTVKNSMPLQETSPSPQEAITKQPDEIKEENSNTQEDATCSQAVNIGPLQDMKVLQHIVLIGLISHIIGSTQQDELVNSTRHLIELGYDILGGTCHAHETSALSTAAAYCAAAIQLGRSPPGPGSSF